MFWFYFIRPLESLVQYWQIKLPIAIVGAALWSVIENLVGVYTDLLSMPYYLLGCATLAFFLDFASAVVAVLRDKGFGGLELIKFRQLLIKAVYWGIVIAAASNFASAAELSGWPWLTELDVVAVLYLSAQDFFSTVQNWKGTEGAKEWIEGAIAFKNGEISLEDVVSNGSQ